MVAAADKRAVLLVEEEKVKKRLIIECAALLLLVVSLLTVSAFAWFSTSVNPSAVLEVQVVGMKSVSASFYRDYEDGAGYTAVQPSSALVDDKLFYPGKSAYCRLDVTNRGGEAAMVSIAFEQVGITLVTSSAEQSAIELDKLNEVFTLDSVIIPHKGDDTFAPDYSLTDGSVTVNKFLSSLKPVLNSGDNGVIALAANIGVPAGATVSVYYRFHLDKDLSELSGEFSLKAGVIKITAS